MKDKDIKWNLNHLSNVQTHDFNILMNKMRDLEEKIDVLANSLNLEFVNITQHIEVKKKDEVINYDDKMPRR